MHRSELATYALDQRLSEIEIAIRYLWLLSKEGQGSAGILDITSFFDEHAISKPNRSRLSARLVADRRVMVCSQKQTFKLNARTIADLDLEFGHQKSMTRAGLSLTTALRVHALGISSAQSRSFVEEAITCAENGTHRAAIIMAWCGAVSVLQEYVLSSHLAAFNEDALRNKLLKNPAQLISDMRDISKESHFIESLARISVIDDATKKSLKRCLDRRNEVGHPSEVRVSEAAVADHIDTLILNVFQPFTGTRLAA